MKRTFIAVVAAALLLPPAQARAGAFTDEERHMFRLLNEARAANRLPALEYDENLADVARGHSEDMRVHKFFRHESRRTGDVKARVERARVPAVVMRENLADARDVPTAHAGLLKSPRHYENIMAPDVTHVGVGITRGGQHPENLLFTQVFAKLVKAEAPEAARARIVDSIQAARREKGLPVLRGSAALDALAGPAAATVPAPPRNSDVKKAARALFQNFKAEPVEGVHGLGFALLYLPQNEAVKVPVELLAPGVGTYGLAIRAVADTPRPMFIIVFLAGA